ncbi:MAG TPA: T9SS type A sorting domain-containing protein [Puia sp.]|jgi:hypothetical protein|nr:T9SS type A sorting domain-containing protein [Puia sp.]
MKQCYSSVRRFFISISLISLCFASSGQTITVINNADAGVGSLRDAITQVNTGLFNVINFTIPGGAPHTISLASNLPTVTSPVTIDGYSQLGSTQGTIGARTITVEINGGNVASIGLDINTSNVTIDGLAIYNVGNTTGPTISGTGINVQPGNSTVFIWGNFIGTNATGVANALPNANVGIQVGVFTSVSPNTGITIGTNGDGTNDANEGNLIVRNGPFPSSNSPGPTDGGVVVFNTSNSKFSGNTFGLGSDGTTNIFNNGTGLLLSDRSSSNVIGTDGDGVSDALERNIISDNTRSGIWVISKSNNNIIAGNVIGMDASSNNNFNTGFGINIDNSSGNRIGTNADGVSEAFKPNYISNNLSGGIQIKSGNLVFPLNNQNADNNVVAGNFIGVKLDGSTAAGNASDGITIVSWTSPFTSNNNTIGSDGSGTREQFKPNVIANNSFSGVSIEDKDSLTNPSLAVGNRISKNKIFSNGTIGIHLVNKQQIGTTGVTPNQGPGFRAGPNANLNFPVITAASANGANNFITISGFARPGAILEFYVADRAALPSPGLPLLKNFGQGKTLLFQAIQGGTLNGITDLGTNMAGSYTDPQEGFTAATGTDPIVTDNTFTFSMQAVTVGITAGGTYTLTVLAIDAGNTSLNANNTSAFSVDFDADFTALPITLIDFIGHEAEGKVYLNWSTSREVDNVAFYIERSGDGTHFSEIGKKAGSLSTTQVKDYNFVDNNPLSGVSFYRLKQIDIDGKFTYSRVIVIRNDIAEGSIKIYPSPFHENLNISINATRADQLRVKIVDQMGRIVNSQQLKVSQGINSFNIGVGLDNLGSGIYIIEVSGETITYKQKLIRN